MARPGYVSLLAMAFSLGLAILGSVLAASLRDYVRTTGLQERRVRADLRLESVAVAVLADLAVQRVPPEEVGGVRVMIVDPLTKVDPAMDSPDEVRNALGSARIEDGVVEQLGTLDGLAAASTLLELSARQEDCLRRTLTYGRAPAGRTVEPLAPSGAAGRHVDVRVSFEDGERDEVLWIRARFTGDERGWLLHDHRRLAGDATCPG